MGKLCVHCFDGEEGEQERGGGRKLGGRGKIGKLYVHGSEGRRETSRIII